MFDHRINKKKYNYIKYIIFSLNLVITCTYLYKYIKIYTFQLIKKLNKKI